MLPDLQRIQHILDYCRAIEKTVQRYGNSFEIFDQDEDFQRFDFVQHSANRRVERRPV